MEYLEVDMVFNDKLQALKTGVIFFSVIKYLPTMNSEICTHKVHRVPCTNHLLSILTTTQNKAVILYQILSLR